MHISQIKESCLYVQDLDETQQFYQQVMEFPLISRVEGRHIFFRAGNSVLLCFIATTTKNDETLPPHYAAGKQHIAFECEKADYDTWKSHLSRHKVAIIQEAHWPGNFHSFYFNDPDGHVLEIVQKGMWG